MPGAWTSLNLTMGLFWIRPDTFVNLDATNRTFLNLKLPASGLNAEFYRSTIAAISTKHASFVELSHTAWLIAQKGPEPPLPPENSYWMVGAYWSESDPQDQTERFLKEGIWENGYKDKFLEDVRSICTGDRIAIKSTFTRRRICRLNQKGRQSRAWKLRRSGRSLLTGTTAHRRSRMGYHIYSERMVFLYRPTNDMEASAWRRSGAAVDRICLRGQGTGLRMVLPEVVAGERDDRNVQHRGYHCLRCVSG